MEAMSNFFAKNGSKDQRLAMFPYKMDTLYLWLLIGHNKLRKFCVVVEEI